MRSTSLREIDPRQRLIPYFRADLFSIQFSIQLQFHLPLQRRASLSDVFVVSDIKKRIAGRQQESKVTPSRLIGDFVFSL